MPGGDRVSDAPKIDHPIQESFQRGAVEQRYRLGSMSATVRQRPQTSEEGARSPWEVGAIDLSNVQTSTGTRELPYCEIETINIARQTGRIDSASGSTANDRERIGSTSRKNPCDGA